MLSSSGSRALSESRQGATSTGECAPAGWAELWFDAGADGGVQPFKLNLPGFDMGIEPSSSEVCSGKGAATGLPRPPSLSGPGLGPPGGCSS